jgi:deoxycytidylate deaminase
MNEGSDLSELYNLRSNFTVIALTGRSGSGCSTIAKQINRGFSKADYPDPKEKDFDLKHNSYRKYEIVYRFAEKNFTPYLLINYREVLTLFLLEYSLSDFENYVNSIEVKSYFNSFSKSIESSFTVELGEFSLIQEEFKQLKEVVDKLKFYDLKQGNNAKDLCDFFFSTQFIQFSSKFHNILKSRLYSKHNLLFQLLTNNLRKSGSPFNSEDKGGNNIFIISEKINAIIKAIRNLNGTAKVVLDSLRNPFEVMFFKQRFAAFYLIAVNRDDDIREKYLKNKYQQEYLIIQKLLEEEYKGGKGKEFYKQYVRLCIEKADIHLTLRSEGEVKPLNEERKSKKESTSPYFSWKMQLLKYLALIEKPGLVTPSPEERCMQMAYTAKYNSGCISRQVGAAVTDEFYSIKAIGWNNTPAGQVPCSLRNVEVLLNTPRKTLIEDSERKFEEQDEELSAFTPYEKTDPKFLETIEVNYKRQIQSNLTKLKGRNVSFCFKTIQNSCSEGKNQVHTRSLHAEESAFLQITKYGGTGIKEGNYLLLQVRVNYVQRRHINLALR